MNTEKLAFNIQTYLARELGACLVADTDNENELT